jgi:precorrin-2 dehydrogenase/sirohydrochlorin ferrochelatase
MAYYPIFADLCGRPCLVVGGGEVATKKVEGLLQARAIVTVISPAVTDTIRQYAAAGEIRHLRRPYEQGDLKGFFLAYAATGVAEVDGLMAAEARNHGVLLNIVDRPALCDFITPAVVRRGDLSIAISTNGSSPGFAKRLRQEIEALIGPEYGAALESVAAQREKLLRGGGTDQSDRHERIETALDQAWDYLRGGSKP